MRDYSGEARAVFTLEGNVKHTSAVTVTPRGPSKGFILRGLMYHFYRSFIEAPASKELSVDKNYYF